jgi:hypothetical protein
VAKVSVSIPDELIDRARALDSTANTSQLVQRGLEQLTAHLAGPDEPGYARRPEDAQGLLAAAREKLLAAARAEYERGYYAGMEDIGDLDWAFMEDLAHARFDLITKLSVWKRGYAPAISDPEFNPPRWFVALMKRFGSMIDPIGFDATNFTPTRPFARGYAAALHDAWTTVESGQDEPPPEFRAVQHTETD